MRQDPFNLAEAVAVLERTPPALDALLRGLPDAWTEALEAAAAWTPRLIVAHLLHCEEEDWRPRAERILATGVDVPFEPFDRERCRAYADGASLPALLDRFAERRRESLEWLRRVDLGGHLERRGVHPSFGEVTLGQLLSTWTVHDLSHLRQVSRAMAKRWGAAVGPWSAYLPVLAEGPPTVRGSSVAAERR